MKFEYVFSDPECPLMFCVCEILKAIRIILKGRQGTVDSFNWYSRRFVFSLIVVLLNFRIVALLNLLSCVRVVECENLKLKFIILNNSSWASCASLDRILVRVNENIKKLVLHLRFINLLHRIQFYC